MRTEVWFVFRAPALQLVEGGGCPVQLSMPLARAHFWATFQQQQEQNPNRTFPTSSAAPKLHSPKYGEISRSDRRASRTPARHVSIYPIVALATVSSGVLPPATWGASNAPLEGGCARRGALRGRRGRARGARRQARLQARARRAGQVEEAVPQGVERSLCCCCRRCRVTVLDLHAHASHWWLHACDRF